MASVMKMESSERAALRLEADKKQRERERTFSDQERLEQVPSSMRKTFMDAYEGKAGLRAAIKAKCQDCSSWQREEIANCEARGCPLWNYRPYQKK